MFSRNVGDDLRTFVAQRPRRCEGLNYDENLKYNAPTCSTVTTDP